MSFQFPTSSQKVTRQIQYFAETAGYGAVVTDPQLINAGIISTNDISLNIDHESVRIQGSRKQYADIKMGVEATFTMNYRLLDTKLLTYGISDPAGAGTLGESLAFVFAQKINNVEEFCIARGCVTESVTINFDRVPNINQTFYTPSLSEWLTLTQFRVALSIDPTTGSPKFATAITAEPWTHLTGTTGSNSAVTINGTAADVAKMTVTINNNLFKQKPLGYAAVRYVEAGNKVVTVSVEPYLYDNTHFFLVQNFTLTDVVGTLKTGTPNVDLTVSGCKFNSYSRKGDAGGGGGGGSDFDTTPIAGTAVDVTVTPFP